MIRIFEIVNLAEIFFLLGDTEKSLTKIRIPVNEAPREQKRARYHHTLLFSS